MEKIRQGLFYLLCIMLIFGILLMDISRVIPSIAMIGIAIIGLSYLIIKPEYAINKNPIPYLALAGTFLILLPSYFYSDNWGYLLEKWRIALPYFILPLAFLMIPPLPKKRYFELYYLYFFLVLLMAISAFVYYLLNQDQVNQLYLESKVMPSVLTHHPTLSLMLAFANYVAYWFFQSGYYYKYSKEKYLFLLGGIFLFIFIHVFSVRSGLLALYALIFYELVRFAVQKRKIFTAILTALGLILIGGTILFLSPTFSNKLANTSEDLKAYQNNESANNKSLASRIISYQNAIKINQESSLLFGCGLGDINDLNNTIFKRDFPDVSKPIIPHNQFLFYLASLGLTGVLAFSFLFFIPFFYHQNYKNVLLCAHYIVIFISFQFEAPMETQLGVAYSLIFILIPIHQAKNNE